MFPIRDHNPSNRTPFVTYGLILINVAVFLSYFPEMGSNPHQLAAFWADYAVVPAEITAGVDLPTLITSMFLHGGWMHLLGNMLYLWIFGDNLEDTLGHVGFLLFYLLAGVAAALAQVAADPYSPVPMVGASGAIAGVLGGYLLLFPKAKVDVLFIFIVFFKVWSIRAWIVLGVWFGLQLYNGAGSGTGGGVAYWAHAGGFVAGAILILPHWLRRGATAFWDRNEGHPPHPDAEYELSKSRIPVVRRRRRTGHDD